MADAPAHEMSRECANLLLVTAESGGSLTEAELREQLGVGHDDLTAMLDQLREQGRAVQTAPGEWSGPDASPDGVAAAAPVVVEVREGDGEPEEAPAARRGWVDEASLATLRAEPTVRLTRTIAEALEADALGKLVLAGIQDCADDEAFVMEVVP